MLISTKIPTVNIARTRIIPAQLAGRDFLSDERTYTEKIIEMFGSSLIGFWPLTEQSGLIAENKVKNYNGNGSYSNCFLANYLGPRGIFAPGFTPAALSYVNLWTPGFIANFNGGWGSTLVFTRQPASTWIDGLLHTIFYFLVNGNNLMVLRKSNINNRFTYIYKAGGAADVTSNVDGLTSDKWIYWACNWGPTGIQIIMNGVPQGLPQATAGVWVGALAGPNAVVGASSSAAPAQVMDGHIQYVAVLNRQVTSDEALMAYLA